MKTDPTIIPTKSSQTVDWINWYQSLADNFGAKVARQTWLLGWSKRGSDAANTNDLRTYMAKQGVTITGSLLGSIEDTALATMDKVTGAIGSVFSIGKYTTIAVAGVILLSVGGIIYSFVRHPKEMSEALGTIAGTLAGTAAKAVVK